MLIFYLLSIDIHMFTINIFYHFFKYNMPTTKFIKQLSLLNKPQIKAFRRFVKSPYHNSVRRLTPLLEEILVYHPKFEDENLAVDKLFVHLYPDTDKEHEGRVNVLFTKLLKLLDEFRIIENFKADKLLYQQVKMQSYEASKMDKSYFKAAKEYEVLLEKMPKDEKHALASFLHYERVYEHSGTNKYDRDSIPFKQCLAFLNKSFLWYSLAYTLRTKNRNRVLNSGEKTPVLTFILDFFSVEIENDPSLFFYKTLIDLQENEGQFEESTALFIESYSNFPLSLQKDGIKVLLNIGMKKIRIGNSYFKETIFKLYKIGIDCNLFLHNNQIPNITFINIVTSSASCNHFSWLDYFINTYNRYINANEKKDTLNLSMGFYFYHKAVQSKQIQDFEKVIDFLKEDTFKGSLFFYRAKTLLLRAYFERYLLEKGDYQFLISQIKAFGKQLKEKKKILGARFRPLIQFTRAILILSKMSLPNKSTEEEIVLFETEIIKNESLFSSEWLLEKARELKSSLA